MLVGGHQGLARHSSLTQQRSGASRSPKTVRPMPNESNKMCFINSGVQSIIAACPDDGYKATVLKVGHQNCLPS
jgi:hypothetical protein